MPEGPTSVELSAGPDVGSDRPGPDRGNSTRSAGIAGKQGSAAGAASSQKRLRRPRFEEPAPSGDSSLRLRRIETKGFGEETERCSRT
jgi:hypothetical protein